MYDSAIRLAAIHLGIDESIVDKNYMVIDEVDAIFFQEPTGKKRAILIDNEGYKIIMDKPVDMAILIKELNQKRYKE